MRSIRLWCTGAAGTTAQKGPLVVIRRLGRIGREVERGPPREGHAWWKGSPHTVGGGVWWRRRRGPPLGRRWWSCRRDRQRKGLQHFSLLSPFSMNVSGKNGKWREVWSCRRVGRGYGSRFLRCNGSCDRVWPWRLAGVWDGGVPILVRVFIGRHRSSGRWRQYVGESRR